MTILKQDKRNDEWRVFMSSVASRLPDGSWGYMGFKSDKWKNMHQEKYRSNLIERKFAPRCNQLVGWNIHSYCCPHAFSYGDRTVESLYALQSIVLDIDCHSERYCKSLRNYRIQTLAHILIHDADDYGLPEPNFIVFTGRGLQVWWNHESMSARKCLNTWKSIVCCFIEIVNKMIADHSEGDPQDTIRGLAVDEQASLNPVGLFRIPGTYNPKAKACAYSVDGVDPNYIYTYQDLVRFRNEYRAEKPIAPQKSKKRFPAAAGTFPLGLIQLRSKLSPSGIFGMGISETRPGIIFVSPCTASIVPPAWRIWLPWSGCMPLTRASSVLCRRRS